ncbi:MAG: DUF4007 family protein [Desulfobacterium sp.]|jgi:hypothetical protein|nr:DUF4007 family protein [Desulfobacterium sp.]
MKYKISGHEKFSLRYTWLPKAVIALKEDSKIFSKFNDAIILMGVGKNMVKSIKFWALSTQTTEIVGDGRLAVTPFGNALFGDNGLDPYLEDIKTLWLLHWKLSTPKNSPLLAWDFLLNRWHEPEITKSSVMDVFENEKEKLQANPSSTTLKDHFDTFIRTYVPTRGPKGVIKEDNLDSPLVELELLQKIGARTKEALAGKHEPIYVFRREEKPEISPELFAYCLHDFFINAHPNESTLPFHEISIGHGSPGQIFKLSENDLRNRLENIEKDTSGGLIYKESSNLQQLQRKTDLDTNDLLKKIY